MFCCISILNVLRQIVIFFLPVYLLVYAEISVKDIHAFGSKWRDLPPTWPTWPRWREVAAQKIWPVPETVVTVLCIPDDGCFWHLKHVEWICRIINRPLCVASRRTINIYPGSSRLTQFKGTIVFPCKNRTKHLNGLRGKLACVWKVKRGGAYSNHWVSTGHVCTYCMSKLDWLKPFVNTQHMKEVRSNFTAR